MPHWEMPGLFEEFGLKKALSKKLMVLLIAPFFFCAYEFGGQSLARINGREIELIVAKNERQSRKGLSGRKRLSSRQGMVFKVKPPARQLVWMKDMRFPLDILWISKDRVVEVSTDVPVKTKGYWTIVQSSATIDSIIEIGAGTVREWGLVPGQRVDWLTRPRWARHSFIPAKRTTRYHFPPATSAAEVDVFNGKE